MHDEGRLTTTGSHRTTPRTRKRRQPSPPAEENLRRLRWSFSGLLNAARLRHQEPSSFTARSAQTALTYRLIRLHALMQFPTFLCICPTPAPVPVDSHVIDIPCSTVERPMSVCQTCNALLSVASLFKAPSTVIEDAGSFCPLSTTNIEQ